MSKDQIIERALTTGAVPTSSSAERWQVCPPSYKMELACADGETSEFAEEGKLMHSAMERWNDDPVKVVADLELNEFQAGMFRRGSEFRQTNLDAIFQGETVDYLIEERHFLKILGEPFCSGEPDLAALGRNTGTLYIEDFKSGRIRVENVIRNKQLKTLAAILYSEYSDKIKRVLWSVNQPLAQCSDRFVEVEPDKLAEMTESVWRAAKAAMESDGRGHVAGPHCRFCKARAVCPLTQQIVRQIAEYKEAVEQLPDDKLGEFPTEVAKKVIELIEAERFKRACNGNPPPGWMLKQDGRRFGVSALDEVAAKNEKLKAVIEAHVSTVEVKRNVRQIDSKPALLSDLKKEGMTDAEERFLTTRCVRIE